MSSTRKSRPPDKGAPAAHKPSHKVALNDVLRSLQDLVQNELTVETAKPDAGTEAKPAPSPEHDTPPETDTAQTATPPRLDTTIRAVPSPSQDTAPAPIPPGGLQQELPYFDSPAEPAAAREDLPALSMKDLHDTAHSENALPAIGQGPENPVTAGLPETFPTAAEDGEPMDIPVLEDAVELADALGAPEMHTSLPAAAEARRIVIQVAARLNVDLRKEGKPGLSSDAIARLVRLLTEALAKAGANMDNTPSE